MGFQSLWEELELRRSCPKLFIEIKTCLMPHNFGIMTMEECVRLCLNVQAVEAMWSRDNVAVMEVGTCGKSIMTKLPDENENL